MRITLQIEMEEADYIGILQIAGMKRMSSEEFIREAIKKHVQEVLDERAEGLQVQTKDTGSDANNSDDSV